MQYTWDGPLCISSGDNLHFSKDYSILFSEDFYLYKQCNSVDPDEMQSCCSYTQRTYADGGSDKNVNI